MQSHLSHRIGQVLCRHLDLRDTNVAHDKLSVLKDLIREQYLMVRSDARFVSIRVSIIDSR